MNGVSLWVPVVAALGAALLSTVGSFGVVWTQRRHDAKTGATAAKFTAYNDMQTRALSFAFRAQALGGAGRFRSGISEGLDVALRMRKPADILELYDWLDAEGGPMREVYSRICAVGSQAAVNAATRLLGDANAVLGAATVTGEQGALLARLKRAEQTPTQAVAAESCP
jgi:hypothetical protein